MSFLLLFNLLGEHAAVDVAEDESQGDALGERRGPVEYSLALSRALGRHRRGHGVGARPVVLGQRRRVALRRRQAAQAALLQAHIRPQGPGEDAPAASSSSSSPAAPSAAAASPAAAALRRQLQQRPGRQPQPARHHRGGHEAAEAARPGAREAPPGAQEGETSHPHTGPDNGQLHRLLAALLLSLHRQADVPESGDTRAGLRDRLLARLHELGPQSRHLHGLQQGLSPSLQADTFQMSRWRGSAVALRKSRERERRTDFFHCYYSILARGLLVDSAVR
ncbi:unnamed protein product [Trichogramma brassicae]|uniref:Uncharacterized protein n=1 Tax=Trichogramma brassicae TaxID=86971 RepID=A0A6H5INK6_9HYME|nr:unnamed protein product [Trichogramma brassicae]